MPSSPISFKGIILTSEEYKEKDRMIRVLTRKDGVINIIVKGVSGRNSKLSFVSIPYSYCDLVVTDNHGFYYLKEGNVISGNTGIMETLESMAVAGHISDLLCWSVMQSENSVDCYELSIYAFYALSDNPALYLTYMIIFNWRLMRSLGLAGGARISIPANWKERFTDRLYDILDYIGGQPVSRIFTIELTDEDISVLRPFTLDYLRVQLERDIADPVLKLNLP